MKICMFILLYIFAFFTSLHLHSSEKKSINFKKIVNKTFKIDVSPFDEAFNPSLCKLGNEYVLTFRYLPEPNTQPWISYVGIMLLDDAFNPLSAPELLDLRQRNATAPSQTEDARIFTYNDQLYIIYNDNRDVTNPSAEQHREMFIAEVIYNNDHFTASDPVKLMHSENYDTHKWEKNWTPFVYQDNLLLYYSIGPNQVLDLNWESEICRPLFTSLAKVNWSWGTIRGGTPAQMVDGEYLAFFHSSQHIKSNASTDAPRWHYFMGAYTFSAQPPFDIKKISQEPINGENFYIKSNQPKRVIYPGGYAISGDTVYVAYGKDDHEVWIASMSKAKLMQSLKPVKVKNRERH